MGDWGFSPGFTWSVLESARNLMTAVPYHFSCNGLQALRHVSPTSCYGFLLVSVPSTAVAWLTPLLQLWLAERCGLNSGHSAGITFQVRPRTTTRSPHR